VGNTGKRKGAHKTMLMAFQKEEKKVASAVCIKLIAICVLRTGVAVLGRWSIQA